MHIRYSPTQGSVLYLHCIAVIHRHRSMSCMISVLCINSIHPLYKSTAIKQKRKKEKKKAKKKQGIKIVIDLDCEAVLSGNNWFIKTNYCPV